MVSSFMDVLSRKIPEIWEIVAAWKNYAYLTRKAFTPTTIIASDIAHQQQYMGILKQTLYEVAEIAATIDRRMITDIWVKLAATVVCFLAAAAVSALLLYVGYMYFDSHDDSFMPPLGAFGVLWCMLMTLIYSITLFVQSHRNAQGLQKAWDKLKQNFSLTTCQTVRSVIDALDASFQDDIDALADTMSSDPNAATTTLNAAKLTTAIARLKGTSTDIFSSTNVDGTLTQSDKIENAIKDELQSLDTLNSVVSVLQYSTDHATFNKTRQTLVRSVHDTYTDTTQYFAQLLVECVENAFVALNSTQGPIIMLADGTSLNISAYVTSSYNSTDASSTSAYVLTDDDADLISTQLLQRLGAFRTYYGTYACLKCYGKVTDKVISAAMVSDTIKQTVAKMVSACDAKIVNANGRQLQSGIAAFVGGILTDLHACFLESDMTTKKCDANQLACLWSTLDVSALFQIKSSMNDVVSSITLLYNTRLTNARTAAITQAKDRLKQRQIIIVLTCVSVFAGVIVYGTGMLGNAPIAGTPAKTIMLYIVYAIIGIMIGYMFVARSIARIEYNETNMRRNTNDMLQQATDFSTKVNDLLMHICDGKSDKRSCSDSGMPLPSTVGTAMLFNAPELTAAVNAFVASYSNCNYLTYQSADAPQFPVLDFSTYVIIMVVCAFVLSYAFNGHSMSLMHVMKTYRHLSIVQNNHRMLQAWQDKFTNADAYDKILETAGLTTGLIVFGVVMSLQLTSGAGEQYSDVLRSLYQVNRMCAQ